MTTISAHRPILFSLIRLLLPISMVFMPCMVRAQSVNQSVRVVAELPALPYIQAGLD